MGKVIRLTESDLVRLVKKIIKEGDKSDKLNYIDYKKIIFSYYNEVPNEYEPEYEEFLQDLLDDVKDIHSEIKNNSELSTEQLKDLEDDIEYLVDWITNL